ncbi:Nif3-like dinuclear metal center hexameric protein [Actinomyces bowdenii]|uniref:Nif3-like dinuclear metal center hexameric protein n=1 Tax=Actinomyces bowdenii TaxID=131109 RepID=UPI00214B2108|nr:Nif3-like dinuclear metal center hexameric protein [Actinomyces bowdenii]MCR2052917.1 Nif3-like dinuclear metal center hexameric protein [Actinomyces bowdenii]MDO5064442.1 Nif3-like dinuclear metal center hexameric protein [Actinomyces bowdenii]
MTQPADPSRPTPGAHDAGVDASRGPHPDPEPRTGGTGLSVAEVVDLVERAAPPALAASWDSNRLICGDPQDRVSSVLLAVDPVTAVVDEAIERGMGMIITHHPLYLRGTEAVAATDPKGRLIHRLIRSGIALLNAHTSLDAAHGGVADALAAAVGLDEVVPLEPDPTDPAQGIGRVGALPRPTSLRDFAATVAAALPDSAPGLLLGGDPEAHVQTIAVSGGAGDSLLARARQVGADVFLTADLRHHPASEHLEGGRPYLLCGTHWATEWVGLPPLAQRLEAEALARGARLTAVVSHTVTDPWTMRLTTADRA